MSHQLISGLFLLAVNAFSWEPLPNNFNVSKPDNLLPAVRNTTYGWPKLPFDMVYVFGDSSCDTGRYMATNRGWLVTSDTAYWRGRFSNGPGWPDYLAAMNNVKVNSLCYAGSVIKTKNFVVQEGVPDFDKQLELYERERNTANYSKPLAIFEFVGNDLLNPLLEVKALGNDVEEILQKLIDKGEIKDIFISMTPVEAYYVKGYDKQLLLAANRLMARNAGVDIFVGTALEQIIYMSRIPPPNADPKRWKVEPCFDAKTNSLCNDPENHFLVDSYHYTTVPYYYLAARISRLIVGYWS